MTNETEKQPVLTCPDCGAEGCLGQWDIVPVFSYINRIGGDGRIKWDGEKEEEWESERPYHDPPLIACRACGNEFKAVEDKTIIVDGKSIKVSGELIPYRSVLVGIWSFEVRDALGWHIGDSTLGATLIDTAWNYICEADPETRDEYIKHPWYGHIEQREDRFTVKILVDERNMPKPDDAEIALDGKREEGKDVYWVQTTKTQDSRQDEPSEQGGRN